MSIAFIGSYTEMITPGFGGHGKGIYTLRLDNQTGKITVIHTIDTINPGYLVISENKKHLYTITEVVEGKVPLVKGYKINKNYSLEFINEQIISGSLPCHITFLNNAVLISCYGTGSILRFPVNANGELQGVSHIYKHSGSSINKKRQKSPHVHQTVIHPNNKHAFVSDLGIDKVKVYTINDDCITPNGLLDIDIPKGLGPRHLVFNKAGDLGYLINELTGDVSILKEENELFKFHKNVESLPSAFNDTPSASAIRLHPTRPYLYVANRTLDAITIFKTINDDLKLIDYQFTKGKTLREFNISPDGNWLIACLQDSDELVIYSIKTNGKLIEKFRNNIIASPVCLIFH